MALDDYVDDGENNGTVAREPEATEERSVENGYTYTIEHYESEAGDRLIDYWLVHGLGHAYSGGSPKGTYTDPLGPDVTKAAYEFFMTNSS